MFSKINEVKEKAVSVLYDKLSKDDVTLDDVNKVIFILKAIEQPDPTSIYRDMYASLLGAKKDAEEKIDAPSFADETGDDELI